MRFLITGGAGFIGSHLTEALLARGDDVLVLDDLSTGKRENVPEGAELMIGDITHHASVIEIMAEVDACFHLAAIASVERSRKDWARTHAVNLSGTIHVFDAAARFPQPKPVVYASSAAVYGDCQELPLAETAPAIPLSAYGADKLGCEQHGLVASQTHGVANTGLRFFNVYGPRQDPSSPYSGVISIFANRIPQDQEIFIYGDGEQTRDFIYVGDVVRHLIAAMERPGNRHDVLNVCTGQSVSILELANTIGELSGCPAKPVHEPPPLRRHPPFPGGSGGRGCGAWRQSRNVVARGIETHIAKHGSSMYRLILLSLVVMVSIWPFSPRAQTQTPRNWVVYYGSEMPPEMFRKYDIVVFDSHNHPPLRPLQDGKRLLLGYISFGEAEDHHYTDQYAKTNNLVVKENKHWNSLVVDVRNPRWLQDIVERQIPFILHQGFHGIMIDTLDSVIYLEQTDPEKYRGMIQASAELIRAVKMHYPYITIMVNRGFEVVPLAPGDINYVLAESTFTTYDFDKKEPRPLTDNERGFYIKQFEAIKNLGIPIVSLDYWNPEDKPGVKAITRLGELGEQAQPATPVLVESLNAKDKQEVVEAARTLGKIGAVNAVPALINTLGHDYDVARATAATALGNLKAEMAVVPLSRLLSDPSPLPQTTARQALRNIGTPEALKYAE